MIHRTMLGNGVRCTILSVRLRSSARKETIQLKSISRPKSQTTRIWRCATWKLAYRFFTGIEMASSCAAVEVSNGHSDKGTGATDMLSVEDCAHIKVGTTIAHTIPNADNVLLLTDFILSIPNLLCQITHTLGCYCYADRHCLTHPSYEESLKN